MTITCGDRVQETTNTTGLGSALSLLGASTQCQSFSAGIGTGNQCTYTVLDGDGVHWFTAIGTYNSGTLSRDTLLNGSNGPGTDVSLSGTTPHTVFSNLLAVSSNVIGQYVTVTSDTTHTFSNIPQCFTDLELTMLGRSTNTGGISNTIQINGLSTAIYNIQRIYGTGTTATVDMSLGQTSLNANVQFPGTSFTAAMIGWGGIRFRNYTNTLWSKVFEGTAHWPNITTTEQIFNVSAMGHIATTAAITSITISASVAWVTGSIFTLRGIM